eukprot:TRINITY_DN11388_c0_g1_i1.p1 TRINITY_DN11388_c0_g1~~TRINITY_DN11388_c0_g1_i1.p1  ORF type:complete len:905 (-),score=244.53 TRINITY_DN11388_c0_g1_i1:70-2784(-)
MGERDMTDSILYLHKNRFVGNNRAIWEEKERENPGRPGPRYTPKPTNTDQKLNMNTHVNIHGRTPHPTDNKTTTTTTTTATPANQQEVNQPKKRTKPSPMELALKGTLRTKINRKLHKLHDAAINKNKNNASVPTVTLQPVTAVTVQQAQPSQTTVQQIQPVQVTTTQPQQPNLLLQGNTAAAAVFHAAAQLASFLLKEDFYQQRYPQSLILGKGDDDNKEDATHLEQNMTAAANKPVGFLKRLTKIDKNLYESLSSKLQQSGDSDPPLSEYEFCKLLEANVSSQIAGTKVFQNYIKSIYRRESIKCKGVVKASTLEPSLFIFLSDEIFVFSILVETELCNSKFNTIKLEELTDMIKFIIDSDPHDAFDRDQILQFKDENAKKFAQLLIDLNSSSLKQLQSIPFKSIQAAYDKLTAAEPVPPPSTLPEATTLLAAWENFKSSSTLSSALSTFNQFLTMAKISISNYKSSIQLFKAVQGMLSSPGTNQLFKLLNQKLSQPEYTTSFSSGVPLVLIIGAGPSGLRSAIEMSCLGCKVVVIEKRNEFLRNNLVHIWQNTIRDIKNLGCKSFYGQICVGTIDHISIKELQLALTKIALLLGVEIFTDVNFNASEASGTLSFEGPHSADLVKRIGTNGDNVDVILGADGANSKVVSTFNFERKVSFGRQSLGITCNFENLHTKQELAIPQRGIVRYYDPDFFNALESTKNISLDDYVYFRDDWHHYFVMTVKEKTLLDKNILAPKSGESDSMEKRIAAKNQSNLEGLVKEVADHCGMPKENKLLEAPGGRNGSGDVSLFDFSRRVVCTEQVKVVAKKGGGKRLVVVVGDAEVEPFWPQGTGVNRGFLSAMDAAWVVKSWFKRGKDSGGEKELRQKWQGMMHCLVNCRVEDLVSNNGVHTIDPKTRYKSL